MATFVLLVIIVSLVLLLLHNILVLLELSIPLMELQVSPTACLALVVLYAQNMLCLLLMKDAPQVTSVYLMPHTLIQSVKYGVISVLLVICVLGITLNQLFVLMARFLMLLASFYALPVRLVHIVSED